MILIHSPGPRTVPWIAFLGTLVFLVPLLAASASVARSTETARQGSGVRQTTDSVTHRGPGVPAGEAGPARFIPKLLADFDMAQAMADMRYCDRGYRSPGGPGYEAALERLAERLREAGFGSDPRLRMRFLETRIDHPVWIPRSASLVLRSGDLAPRVLHAFAHVSDRDRTMLPLYAPSADVEGRPVFALGDVAPGTVLVTEAKMSPSLLRRAEKRGAVAVLSSYLFAFTQDPTGRGRHVDAILFTKVAPGTSFPVADISPRVRDFIEAAADENGAWLALTAEVEEGEPVVRTLVAEIVGARRPQEAIAVVSHVQEPGAGDNASGIVGLAQAAAGCARALLAGTLEWPDRSLCLVWGDEMHQSRAFLADTQRTVVAGISADMLGQSAQETGAIMLLERAPDPGALVTLEPDAHTPWGAGEVLEEDLSPSGLHVVARAALVDVGRRVKGGWTTAENPWEGGSDHDVFLEHGIPAVLLWHFTDFTYHTSLDRMEVIDPLELRRSVTAVMATALALASPGPGDLERYLEANEQERKLRVGAARQAGEVENAAAWEVWCDGAAEWLKSFCAR